MSRNHKSFDELLLAAQLNRLVVWMEEVTELTPQRGYKASVTRCPTWPVCDHPGCEMLRDVQAHAAAELARMKREYRDPFAASRAVSEDAAALDRAADQRTHLVDMELRRRRKPRHQKHPLHGQGRR